MSRLLAAICVVLWLASPRHPLEEYDRPRDQWGELDGLTNGP